MSHIFITGGTGVIGSTLIPQLLDRKDVRLTVLLRAESKEHLQHRASKLMEFCNVTGADEAGRIHFVKGDVHCEQLGLTLSEYRELQHTATGIVHSAGNVKLNQTIEDARQNAVEPILEILKLARSTAKLQKVDAVSTIGVAGKMPGMIPERRLMEPREFHNNYERAKAEAEELLWEAIDEGMPISIHRPSMVVGDSQSGRIIQFQVFYHICEFLSGVRTHGVLPRLGHLHLDVVPVDYIARAVAISCMDAQTAGCVFHLCAGKQHSLDLQSLTYQIRQLRSQQRKLPSQKWIHPLLFQWIVNAHALMAPTSPNGRALRSAPHLLAYLASNQTFDTEVTKAYFKSQNMELQSVATLVPQLLAYQSQMRNTSAQAITT
jgi:thioester reductase-like protein